MLAAIENYQYSRMRILHMIGTYYISKQDKLMRKRKHLQIRRMLRKLRSYWYEKIRTEDWWLKMIGEEASGSSWKKKLPHDKRKFHEVISKDFSPDIA